MNKRPENWFAEMFGQAVDAIGDGIGDVRDKLVFESFFQRHVPERQTQNDLGWFQDHPAASGRTAEHSDADALSQFYGRLSPAERAEHFRAPANPADREPDRGIDL